jgi:hypothetical protein
MLAAFIPILPSLEKELQWGMQLTHFEYVIMMKRPKESATGSGLLAPFEIEVRREGLTLLQFKRARFRG